VVARFIPRFYYEGPFTPVAEEEKEDARNSTAMATTAARADAFGQEKGFAAVPAQELRRQKSGRFGASSTPPTSSSSSSSPPSPVKEKADFLETSTTLLEARRRAHDGSACGSAAAAAADPGGDRLVDEVRAQRIAPLPMQRPFRRRESIGSDFCYTYTTHGHRLTGTGY